MAPWGRIWCPFGVPEKQQFFIWKLIWRDPFWILVLAKAFNSKKVNYRYLGHFSRNSSSIFEKDSLEQLWAATQPTFTCSKSTIETLEKDVKFGKKILTKNAVMQEILDLNNRFLTCHHRVIILNWTPCAHWKLKIDFQFSFDYDNIDPFSIFF